MKKLSPKNYSASESSIYSLAEEIANAITHGLGAILSVAGLTLMVVLTVTQDDLLRIVSAIIYGTTLILLFLTSTLYHSFQHTKTKNVFQLLDHCAIYLLIAGTYTPFLLISLNGLWGYTLMAIIWGMALFGIFFKVFFMDRFPKVSLFTYILMGWLIIIASGEMIARVPTEALILLATGGVIYTAGTIFYSWERIPFNHAIWHVFVLMGSTFHFFAVYSYVLAESA